MLLPIKKTCLTIGIYKKKTPEGVFFFCRIILVLLFWSAVQMLPVHHPAHKYPTMFSPCRRAESVSILPFDAVQPLR